MGYMAGAAEVSRFDNLVYLLYIILTSLMDCLQQVLVDEILTKVHMLVNNK